MVFWGGDRRNGGLKLKQKVEVPIRPIHLILTLLQEINERTENERRRKNISFFFFFPTNWTEMSELIFLVLLV